MQGVIREHNCHQMLISSYMAMANFLVTCEATKLMCWFVVKNGIIISFSSERDHNLSIYCLFKELVNFVGTKLTIYSSVKGSSSIIRDCFGFGHTLYSVTLYCSNKKSHLRVGWKFSPAYIVLSECHILGLWCSPACQPSMICSLRDLHEEWVKNGWKANLMVPMHWLMYCVLSRLLHVC